MDRTLFELQVEAILVEIQGMLIEKNRKYGDSALAPLQCFSKASPTEAIRVRIDDKLKRMMNRQDDDTEDIELDLIGYLILLRIAKFEEEQC